MTTHDVGLHGLGWDPDQSVVDPFGKVHECNGLYAIGGECSNHPAYNPTETIMALAYMTADHALGRL